MPVTLTKKNGRTIVFGGASKPATGPVRYQLGGKLVTVTEASHRLGVGLVTIMRHTRNGVIDVKTIRSLTPVEPPSKPLREAKPAKRTKPTKRTKPQRGPAHWYDEKWTGGGRTPAKVRNTRIITRIVAAFHEVSA